jgi:hypothetical protein
MGLHGFIPKKINKNYYINERKNPWEPFRICLLKVALSQKILKNFFVAKINIPNHYPEQKI